MVCYGSSHVMEMRETFIVGWLMLISFLKIGLQVPLSSQFFCTDQLLIEASIEERQ